MLLPLSEELGITLNELLNGERITKENIAEKTEGIITGLVKSHLFRNEIYGNVLGGALIGWGTSQGGQYWGDILKKRIPLWFPCISYQADGKEINHIMGEGTWKGTWKTGQKVIVRYDPKNICQFY